VKLDVQLNTAGQIDCGCPESGGRLAVLGTVLFCPADPRILRDVGAERERCLRMCCSSNFFIQLISTISSRRAEWVGPGGVGDFISNNVNIEGSNIQASRDERLAKARPEKFH
jgi:hypothetical protein